MREAAGEPEGALVLFHGRGADELDLFPLLGVLDPDRRLLGVTPRGPLSLPPGGAHWYAVMEIGYPDPGTFLPTFALASDWLDGLAESTAIPPERTILGGFSQGAVMTYALGLGLRRRLGGADLQVATALPARPSASTGRHARARNKAAEGRPRPAGLIALSGFIPTVAGFEIDLESEQRPPVAIGHGIYDPVIGVEWGRRARAALEAADFPVTYRESPLPHAIDPRFLAELQGWVATAIPAGAAR